MAGFFSASELQQDKAPAAIVPRCGACGLYKKCKTPKIPYSGEGRKGILIVGDGPSSADDEAGSHWNGASGEFLRRTLSGLGISISRDCWSVHAIICHADHYPTNHEIGHCAPNLRTTIENLKPSVIIPLGATANKAVISLAWNGDIKKFDRWQGWNIPGRLWNAWICPTWHPTEVQREKKMGPQLLFWWEAHLKAALEKAGSRPFETIPDETKEITRIYNPDEAAGMIRKIIDKGGVTAFDYETTTLKPECDAAEIVSCSICWRGKKTFAYAWEGAAIQATDEYLKSPVPKIASNMKFEERWTIAKLGHRVRNWVADTMLDAHLLDTRDQIASIKLQAFVLLGAPSWNEHIKPFLESDGTMTKNRIRDISLPDLLLYNGLDSLYEFRVAERQAVDFGTVLGE